MPSVNRIRLRRSGTLNILRTAARNFSIKVAQTLVCVSNADHRLTSVPLRTDNSNGAAGLFNLLARAPGKAVRRHLQRLGDLAIAEHDNIVFGFLDNATMMHDFGRYLVVCRKLLFQRSQADFDPLLFENIREAALGQPAMQGHLAAFETDLHRIAGTRLLSFFTATRSLAQPGAGSAPETLLPVGRTLCRVQIVETKC